jgi:transcription elongation factor GreB
LLALRLSLFMSKAFTRESDESGDDENLAIRPPLPPGVTNYITPQGAERLQQRLRDLLDKKEQFATSPNDSELKKLEFNIRALRQTLNSVTIANPAPNPDKVAFGVTVRIRDQNSEEETYRIVGVDEAEPENNSISWLSPLARGLLSRKVGDTVQFRTPAGARELTILGIA